MEPYIDPKQPSISPENAAHQRLQADLRLFARLEASTILLQTYVEAGRVAAQQAVQRALPEPPEPAFAQSSIPGGEAFQWKGKSPVAPSRDIEPGLAGKRPYSPRVSATPIMVLAFRAAEMLPETAKATHAIAIDLINRGVDLEAAVFKRRVSDYVLQFLRECAVDITALPQNAMYALRAALDHIDEVIAEAVAWVKNLPGHAEHARRQRQAASQQSPQGP